VLDRLALHKLLVITAFFSCAPVFGASVLFQTDIPGPNAIALCGKTLWISSVPTKELRALDPSTGKTLEKMSSERFFGLGQITALACVRDQLFVSTAVKFRGTEKLKEYEIGLFKAALGPPGTGKITGVESVRLPGKSLVQDLFAVGSKTYLIQGNIFVSTDLKQWKEAGVPDSAKIKNIKFDTEKNPFADWQESFFVFEGRYTKGLQLKDGKLAFLDPFRGNVVIQEDKNYIKWGHWGMRPGNLMFSKSITPLDGLRLAISDVGTKLISIFSENGDFLELVGKDGKLARFGYPMSIQSQGNSLFVADFLDNKVFALSAPPLDKVEIETEPDNDFLQHNLFRHPDNQKTYAMVRCLNCHDGTERFSLEKFQLDRTHHPIDVEVKKKIDLPLTEDHKVSCFTCHQAHHKRLSGVVTGHFGDQKKLAEIPHMLRRSDKDLCLTCHEEKALKDESHFGIKSKKMQKFTIDVRSCFQCHQMHSGEKHLLSGKVPDLCISCHTKERIPKSHPLGGEQDVSCISCHTTHGAKKSEHFARHKTKDLEGACLSCHKDRKPLVGTIEHLKLDPKKKILWNQQEAVCLTCHDPHKEKQSTSKACLVCHEKQQDRSHDKNIAPLFARLGLEIPKEIHLDQGKISCATCHDPHGIGTDKKLLRKQREIIIQVCSGACHEPKGMEERFDKYHDKQGKSRGKR